MRQFILFLFMTQCLFGDAVSDTQRFSFELLRTLSGKEKNLCFSPLNISAAMAMAYQGARGRTQREMERVFGFSSNPSDVSSSLLELSNKLSASNNGENRILLANSIWIQKGLSILPEFLHEMNRYYKTSGYFVDFRSQPESSRSNINNWVSQATQGKIENLLASGSITQATRMVLASAIYLKARWQSPFSEKQTMKHPFFGFEDTTSSVPMMTHTESYPYLEDSLAQLVELPYANRNWAMLCILPLEKVGMGQVEENLTSELFNRWRKGLAPEQIQLYFPKFKINAALNLEDTLGTMGMPSAFDERADFSGIDGTKDLAISQIAHKAFIAADEAGTEAAAATAVVMSLKSSLQEFPPRVLKLDRPFLFIIYDKPTGAILFMGRVANPLE